MLRGTPEGVTRLSQGDKAGRGSFLRLATRAVGAGIGAIALNQLEPAQKALAKTTIKEQRRDGNTASKSGEQTQSDIPQAPSIENQTEQAEAFLGLPEPLPEILAATTVLGIAGIGAVVWKKIQSRRRHERERREPGPLYWQLQQRAEETRALRREAEERERVEEYRRRTHEAEERERLKQKRVDETARGKQTIQELAQEIRDEHIDQLAEDTKRSWEDNEYHARVHLKEVHVPFVRLQDDGTEINDSRSGIILSYVHEELSYEYYSGQETFSGYSYHEYYIGRKKEELYLGIGYVRERNALLPETQESVSDAELWRGVKAYLLGAKDNPTAIPLAYPESQQIFLDQLSQRAESLSPEQVIPEARASIKEELGGRRRRTWHTEGGGHH